MIIQEVCGEGEGEIIGCFQIDEGTFKFEFETIHGDSNYKIKNPTKRYVALEVKFKFKFEKLILSTRFEVFSRQPCLVANTTALLSRNYSPSSLALVSK